MPGFVPISPRLSPGSRLWPPGSPSGSIFHGSGRSGPCHRQQMAQQRKQVVAQRAQRKVQFVGAELSARQPVAGKVAFQLLDAVLRMLAALIVPMNHLAVAQGIPIGGDRPVHIPAMLVRIRAAIRYLLKTLLRNPRRYAFGMFSRPRRRVSNSASS